MQRKLSIVGVLWSLFLVAADIAPAHADESKHSWGDYFDCSHKSKQSPEACQALKLYQQGTLPSETSLGTARIVDIGYLADADGTLTNKLVVIDVSWTRNYHEKMYYPNKICSISVKNAGEGKFVAINQALNDLHAGKVPINNQAYRWAMRYEFPLEECDPLEINGAGNALISSDGDLAITAVNGQYIVVARSWGRNDSDMVLIHRKRH